MGIIGIIGLIFRIIFMLPSLIRIGKEIIKLLPKFKGAGFWEILQLIGEILKLILGLAPKDKEAAKELMVDLLTELKFPKVAENPAQGLKELKEKAKKKCEGQFCPSDLVGEE